VEQQQPIFEDVQDYETMKDLMREMARRFQVDLHAYVLLPAQFHVLATPETEEGLPLFMQAVGRSYVRYFNNRHGRSGTLWKGATAPPCWRPRLSAALHGGAGNPAGGGRLVQGARRTGLWSSYAHNAGVQQDSLVRSHAQYWALANTPFAREAAYQRTVEHGVSAAVAEEVLAAASVAGPGIAGFCGATAARPSGA
jgi:putative transposase